MYEWLNHLEHFAYDLYETVPVIKNWPALIFLYSRVNKPIKLKFKSIGILVVKGSSKNKKEMFKLIRLVHRSISAHKIKNGVAISLDGCNMINLDLDLSKIQNRHLINLIHDGYLSGANFRDANNRNTPPITKSTIILTNNKRIIETSDGIRFDLKYISVGLIIETFIRRIHDIDLNYDGNVVVDVGSNMGDTPLLFAKKGARVYAFEPIKENYAAMQKNIHLNRSLKRLIKPINAAISEINGVKVFRLNPELEYLDGGASAFVEDFKRTKTESAKSYTLSSVYKKYKITSVELLKMDAKGAEFLLREADLKIVKNLKIEYTVFGEHKLQDLLTTIKNAGFSYTVFSHSPAGDTVMAANMMSKHGTIYAKSSAAN